ncbi:hypothetical protein niasHT_000772 [Heterodera trifolii]|uniref:Uncharacterized protein n=1 Tax=Heterodera trifolii TaxID=157864 RepID=A0ABD2LQX2_9BILA
MERPENNRTPTDALHQETVAEVLQRPHICGSVVKGEAEDESAKDDDETEEERDKTDGRGGGGRERGERRGSGGARERKIGHGGGRSAAEESGTRGGRGRGGASGTPEGEEEATEKHGKMRGAEKRKRSDQ